MLKKLEKLEKEALELIKKSHLADDLEKIRIKYLGRKGELSQLAKKLPALSALDKRRVGQALNKTLNTIENKIKKQTIKLVSNNNESELDQDEPALAINNFGHLHLITQAIEEISLIFEKIGFNRVRYPEVDWDWFAFEALNMPKDHPARDEWETLFIDLPKDSKMGKAVLTPHTSNGQVREMLRKNSQTPIRMINIGKCYRRQQDVTHTAMFHQFEGLVIDKHVNIQHLKGTLDHFAKKYYGPSAKSRIRPFMFKFTEPSFEVDFSCTHCAGAGCRFCKSGWHEVGGAGMVHPNVLKAGGIDPDKYTGFAFGWGVERVFTLKPGLELDDIRPFYGSNLEFLSNF